MGFMMNAFRAIGEEWRKAQIPNERMSEKKNLSRYTYTDGPMYFLGQQIVKEMERMGYPAFIHCCYRSPEEQRQVYADGFSDAPPYRSPHQYFEAVDIVHKSLYWEASDAFWDALADCAELVAKKYGVVFDGGYKWGWDFAHIEIEEWRPFRDRVGKRVPSSDQLAARFEEVLPRVWKQYTKSLAYQKRRGGK